MEDISEIINILESYSVSYTEDPKYTTEKAIGVHCPFCDDSNYHGGIFKTGFSFYCFRCHRTATLFEYCNQIDIPYPSSKNKQRFLQEQPLAKAKDILTTFNKNDLSENKSVETQRPISLPDSFISLKELTGVHKQIVQTFLEYRSFAYDFAQTKGCGYCFNGFYKMRLIIPVFSNNKIVSWQARTVANNVRPKYITAKGSRDALYFSDSTMASANQRKEVLYIVEGVFDNWRIEQSLLDEHSEAVSTFGTHITPLQFKTIIQKNYAEIRFMWDSDAIPHALKYAVEFKPFFKKVSCIILPHKYKDPDNALKNRTVTNILQLFKTITV